ncbi:MAG: CBS domain-containing protein [Candidatus Omnitrophica bacterium]|nr:CBS domain-containing protein [Candidatus Omnitrophota bacterium]MCM8790714.1 CBS domain-containing protein [Candidatus Omnitrophota bacterium]
MSVTAKDCMSRDVKYVSPEMNAKDALKVLIESGASGLPVMNPDGEILGVFTEKEILKTILPSYLKGVGNFVYGDDSKVTLKKLANLDKFQVKDIMRKEVPIVTEDTSVAEISRLMLARSERRVMVVRENKAVGVVTRADVVRALARQAGLDF